MNPQWWAARAKLGEPGRPSARLERAVRRFAAPVVKLAHRPELDGVDHLPDGPFMLVANHSAIAEKALESGVSVLVFPGGDYEATRPIWQANQVCFAGRKGFLRIARAACVPIVPMGITGSVFTAPIVWRSRRVLAWLTLTPRLFGIRHMPVTVLGLLGALALLFGSAHLGWPLTLLLLWLWMGSPLALLPWIPSTIRMHIGKPIAHAELFATDDVDGAYERVEREVQALVTGVKERG